MFHAHPVRLLLCSLVFMTGLSAVYPAETVEIAPLAKAINAVGPHGAGHGEAMAAWGKLARVEAARLPEVLAGMDGANRLSVNWLRGAVETIAQRQLDRGEPLPIAALEAFLADTSHAPLARRTAYELMLRVDPTAKTRLIAAMLNDPSLELRREAVAQALADAGRLLAGGQQADATAAFRTAFTAARDLDQIREASRQLRSLGEQVDLPRHLGFITQWQLAAPFDNTNMSGLDVAYGPEVKLDLAASYPGKSGTVAWIAHTTQDDYGVVDLNKALGKQKAAVAYAYAEFLADRPRDAELRLGCITANKLWLNGELLTANNVYHSGTQIDQYVSRGRLRAGQNVILMKICQNDQTEPWAQNWQFQLRVCDPIGTAILSTDRQPLP